GRQSYTPSSPNENMESRLESVQASARELIRPSRERMGTRCLSMAADCRFGKGDLVSML
ncbi:hypothetical protein AVEN_104430-1, partial [Araneus ventricosus]